MAESVPGEAEEWPPHGPLVAGSGPAKKFVLEKYYPESEKWRDNTFLRQISGDPYIMYGVKQYNDWGNMFLSDYRILKNSASEKVEQNHVKIAQHQIEADQMTPVIAKLPNQQKIVLGAILINEKNGLKNIQTGEVYSIYSQACRHLGTNALTQRRVSGLISSLDMLGLITARTISKGRYGRSKEINSCIPQNINPVTIMAESEPELENIFNGTYKYQTRL